ncbi:MAG: LysR substrate-binding domain-containing protein [Pseudomonadota bacterium]|nr:LysR substrate-binding domain-containing protein [Pseudomonadota bacterium]
MYRLPPFDALVAFESVARLGGMTRAAGELGLTQSAVSHRIRRLEDFMGVALFDRHPSGLSLTSGGLALSRDVSELLSRASELRHRCSSAVAPERLRVGVYAALADNWLVRRLPAFAASHPDIRVELFTVENEVPERVAAADIRLGWVNLAEARASSTQRPLHRERVLAVCAPGLMPAGADPADPRLLTRLPLLHKYAPGSQGQEWFWQTWFDRLGLNTVPEERMRFTSIGPVIAAAVEGTGAALVRSMLVRDALADGRLVRLLTPEHDLLSTKVNVVRWPAWRVGDVRVRAFADWLARESAATEFEDQV